MSKLSKALIAAAGNAGGEALYVEDVFSTYLYEGTGNSQAIRNGIALADSPGGGTSTSFDGVGDYLSRSSALTGATNSKTFTYNFWGIQDTASKRVYAYSIEDFTFRVYASADYIYILARNSSNSNILFGELTVSASIPISIGNWFNFLLSVDLTDNTKRHVFVNDQDITSSITWSTYTNDSIEFSKATQRVGRNRSDYTDGNLAHVYLDYTYRDLSIESNRRLFIDSDGGSTSVSTLSSLSPILYLPMTNSYAVGENIGTGGDFSVNGSPTIVNTGPEWLSGEGGMVWLKGRTGSSIDNYLTDTERGKGKALWSNLTNATFDDSSNWATGGFNSNGFTIPAAASSYYNKSGSTYASWTFRKAEKFFDVVTYTGNGEVAQYVNHNLGVAPAVIILKSVDSAGKWYVWHKDLTSTSYSLRLNTTAAESVDTNYEIGLNASDTQIYIDTGSEINFGTGQYVAYLFASDAGGFGDDGSESIIKCGSLTTTSSGDYRVELGFEPQWLLVKRSAGGVSSWWLLDTMRSMPVGSNDAYLEANTSNAELNSFNQAEPDATGFTLKGLSGSSTYIYIAIRRPMKTPESGTEVFAIDQWEGATTLPTAKSGFPVDMAIWKDIDGSDGYAADRMRGRVILRTNTTGAETSSSAYGFDYQNGYLDVASNDATRYSWMFKRATGFFDVVAYTGDGTTPRNITHNLGAVPEFIVTKRRDVGGSWAVYNPDLGITSSSGIRLNTDDGWGYSQLTRYPSTPTSTVYTVGNDSDVNSSGNTFISYLWTTLAGVSKVGSYTGTGSNVDVDCGFAAGARLVIIKRYGTSTTGDWYVWDSVRGIVAGNDPYLLLNSTAAEVTTTDYIDPLASGFTVTSSAPAALNASGGTYIFLAIA